MKGRLEQGWPRLSSSRSSKRGIAGHSAERAVDRLRSWALAGHPAAQVNLGLCYATGHLVRRNRAKANDLYRLSAEQGNSVAAHNLGVIYRDGLGVERDCELAYLWYAKAVQLGDTSSVFEMLDLIEGKLVGHSPEWVLTRLHALAEAGNSRAQVEVGVRCFEGKGLPQDSVAALHWYRRAARKHDGFALFNLALMHKNGDAVVKSWPKALAYFRRADAADHSGAAHWLARYYDGKEGHPVRDVLALKWLRRSARLGDTQSTASLGVRYHEGRGVRRSLERAARLYRMAADMGDARGMYLLGLCYRDGEGVGKDIRRARVLWARAAAGGVTEAAGLLAGYSAQ